jgi:cellulose biosynthesis protein BcsQ
MALPIGTLRFAASELQKKEFQDLLRQVEVSQSLLLMDLPTLQGPDLTEVLTYADHVVVPVTPDIHSIGSLAHLEKLLASSGEASAGAHIHYVLNRFDESRVLHHEIRDRLRERLGNSLLPFVIPEDSCVGEASANGMTIADYRPESALVRELTAMAGWMRSLSQR